MCSLKKITLDQYLKCKVISHIVLLEFLLFFLFYLEKKLRSRRQEVSYNFIEEGTIIVNVKGLEEAVSFIISFTYSIIILLMTS